METELHTAEPGQPIDYLRLVRIWNLPTAIADSYAGYLLAIDPFQLSIWPLLGVMLVSALIYSGGMIWNDVLDAPRDKTLHPGRPIPSGVIGRKIAARLGLGLIVAGLAVSLLVGAHVFLMTLALVALTFIYNAWLKRHGFVGCLAMGGCRFLNMWLGMAAAGATLWGALMPFPATLGLYVTAVTLLSLLEEMKIGRFAFYAIIAVLLATLLPLAAFALRVNVQAPLFGHEPSSWLSLVPLALLFVWMIAVAAPAGRQLSAGAIGRVVRTALTGIILLDSAMLFVCGRQLEGALCAALILPTLIMIQLIAQRPRPVRA